MLQENARDRRQKPLANIIRTFCNYDQLIDYTNSKGQVQWIHVSFKREGKNRNEWLHKKALFKTSKLQNFKTQIMKFKGIIRNVGETVLAAFSSWKLLRSPKETLRSPKEKSDGSATILSQIFQTYYFNWY